MSAPATTTPEQSTLGERRIDGYAAKIAPKAGLAVLAGVMIVLLSLIIAPMRERLAPSYLAGFAYFLSIALGMLFFVVLQHLVKAGWSVVVRRVAEGIALNVGLMLLLALPVVLFMGKLYPWAHWGHEGAPAAHGELVPHDVPPPGTPPTATEHDAPGGQDTRFAPEGDPDTILSQSSPLGMQVADDLVHPHPAPSKSWYLSKGPFIGRLVLYFVLWLVIAGFYHRRSVAQDADGDLAHTLSMQWWAPPAMIAFALTCSLAGFDLLMTMDPSWYSTMFGVYWFAGCAVSSLAALILFLYTMQRHGLIKEVNPEHYHDVGKLMFAFIVFWAYIAYSQFMLIWYGNIPEETAWFQRRIEHGWLGVSAFLVIGHFVIPFLCLISRHPKRHPHLLALGAAWVLLVHYVDMMWLTLPQPPDFLKELGLKTVLPDGHRSSPAPFIDLGIFLALGGLFVWRVTRNLSGASLIPERDPRLGDSLRHENF